jgi:hypothetical protein
MIHPRRPVGPPTTGDKEEGLAQYNPFIPIIPQHAVTLDNRVAGEALHVATSSGQCVLHIIRSFFIPMSRDQPLSRGPYARISVMIFFIPSYFRGFYDTVHLLLKL